MANGQWLNAVKIVILLSRVPHYARLRVPFGKWLWLEIGVAEGDNALHAPLCRYIEERAQILLCLLSFGHIFQAWATSYMHPARSQTMLNDREL